MSTDYECGCNSDLHGWHLCNNHERAVLAQSKLLTRERVTEAIKNVRNIIHEEGSYNSCDGIVNYYLEKIEKELEL